MALRLGIERGGRDLSGFSSASGNQTAPSNRHLERDSLSRIALGSKSERAILRLPFVMEIRRWKRSIGGDIHITCHWSSNSPLSAALFCPAEALVWTSANGADTNTKVWMEHAKLGIMSKSL
jgi:hypothetical protein